MRIKGWWRVRAVTRRLLAAWGRLYSGTLLRLGFDPLSGARIHRCDGLGLIGSPYGGWIVPHDLLGRDSICYCAGVGEDITFDLGLINTFGCHVFAFDPTPRARLHVEKEAAGIEQFHFFEYGLWESDKIVRFFAPKDPSHVSYSALNLQKTERFFDAPCKRLSTVVQELGHSHIDLLKLDIEGAEYAVLRSMLEDGIKVGILCVEYHALDKNYRRRIRQSMAGLRSAGYLLVARDEHQNYTFLKKDLIADATPRQ